MREKKRDDGCLHVKLNFVVFLIYKIKWIDDEIKNMVWAYVG
jgi:hypothetical protein